MYIIKKVTIRGFWGIYIIETKFHPDINIFIGDNGSGKTTFINILTAALKPDLRSLLLLEFSNIEIILCDCENSKITKLISIDKVEVSDRTKQNISYDIDGIVFEFSAEPADFDRLLRRSSMMGDSLSSLEKNINGLLNISSLSVHRTPSELQDEEARFFRRTKLGISSIDERLLDLERDVKSYQLTLRVLADQISAQLQKDVLASMLYTPEYDKFNPTFDVDLIVEKESLSNAFKSLGALDPTMRKKIDKHIDELNKMLERIRKTREGVSIGEYQSTTFLADDIVPMSLTKRTQYIIDVSLEAEEKRKQVYKLLSLFEDILNEFLADKRITLTADKGLQILKENKEINLLALSSGEKQILILLIETLLQKEEPFVFLADEPEISLHIKWQAQIISSIRKLNKKAQIIVATHSPEIAASGQNRIIDMEDILHE